MKRVRGRLGRRVGLLVLGLWAAVWGLLYGSAVLFAFGVALSLSWFALLAYPRWVRSRIRLVRRMAASACEDDAVVVAFDVENHSRLPAFGLELEDRFTPDKVPRREALVFPGLRGRRRTKVRYWGRCYAKRGVFSVGPARAAVSDPCGLFYAWSDAVEVASLVVYPALAPVLPLASNGLGRAALLGGSPRRSAGEGDLPLGVRHYRPGDPLRRVHWPSSARHGRLVLREYEREVARPVWIFLDLCQTTQRGLGKHSTLELSVHVAAALTHAHLRAGDRVGLIAEGASSWTTPAARGPAQRDRILEALARVRPDGARPLVEVTREHLPLISPRDTCVLLIADSDPAPWESVLHELHARRCRALCVVLDLRSFRAVFGVAGDDLPPSLHTLAAAYAQWGGEVYACSNGEPVEAALARPYAGRPRLRISQGSP
ncbi:MAG: DUF58 domain-containing protein [Planctomycetes bacterium]|nr:DUF58 domain-containing protein [Planctomycetota bacterium]